jgi:hypothetical protein
MGYGDAVVNGRSNFVLLDFQHAAKTAIGDEKSRTESPG